MYKMNLKKTVLLLSTAIVFCALAILSGCISKSKQSASENIPQIVKKEGWTEVGKNIYVFTGDFYMVNILLVTSGKNAALIDTGMYNWEFQKVQDFMKERKLKLKNIIITHMHSDHTANLAQLDTKNIVPITPANAQDNQIVKVGNKNLRIIFTEGHYKPNGHISVEVEEDNVLIAGDIICNNIIPPIAAGGDINELLDTLSSIQEKGYSVIVPGHGEVVENDLIFKRQFEYLENAKSRVEDLISKGGKKSDLGSIKLSDCVEDTSYLYKESLDYWHRQSLEVIYQQLAK